jgi:hypothetical protein
MTPIELSLTPDQAVVLLGLLASSRMTSEPSWEQRLLQEIEQQVEHQLLDTVEPETAPTVSRVNAA